MLNQEQLAELLTRSANGEGVHAVLKEFGVDIGEATLWLRDNHHAALKEAKKAFASDPVKVAARKEAYLAEVAAAELAKEPVK